jgi:cell division protein FtsW
LFITSILVTLGTIMVFSSSVIMADTRWHSPYLFIGKQAIFVIIGAIAMFVFSRIDYREYRKYLLPRIGLSMILLVLVLIIGPARGGARRWLNYGPLNLQPSEIAKMVMVLTLANYIDRKKSKLHTFKGLVPALCIIGMFCSVIALEPDLGTPVLMVTVGLSMLFIAGARLSHILGLFLAVLPLVVEEILRKPYRLARLKSFIVSWGDIRSVSYQLDNSIMALGSGGILGKGLAKGQMKLLYLPEAHTDFIFPIIGEELGFIGALLVIALFLLFAWRGMRIGYESKDLFGGMLAIGITLIIAFQALINMGVACGVLPTKGLPLPFVSFGGTALVIYMASVGVLLNVSARR